MEKDKEFDITRMQEATNRINDIASAFFKTQAEIQGISQQIESTIKDSKPIEVAPNELEQINKIIANMQELTEKIRATTEKQPNFNALSQARDAISSAKKTLDSNKLK